jgi:hypothetical protein
MILELAGFILAFSYKSRLENVYRDSLKEAFDAALSQNNTKVVNVFHDLEKELKCCGVNGPTDYNTHPQFITPDCYAHPTGCSTAIIDWLDKNLPIIGGVLGGVLLLEIVGLLSAVALVVALRHAPDDTYSSDPRLIMQELIPGRRRNYSRV